MLQFCQTVSGDASDTQDDVQSVGSSYWLSGVMGVNTVNCCEHLLAGIGDESCERLQLCLGTIRRCTGILWRSPIPQFTEMPKIPNILVLLTISLESVPG